MNNIVPDSHTPDSHTCVNCCLPKYANSVASYTKIDRILPNCAESDSCLHISFLQSFDRKKVQILNGNAKSTLVYDEKIKRALIIA